MSFSKELEFALSASQDAGRLVMTYFGSKTLKVMTKRDASPVTIADQKAETLIRSLIKKAFPKDAILGEEFGVNERQKNPSGRKWVIDPIDGTKSFIHGVPLFGVMIGVEMEGVPTVGVVHFPGLGETYYAEKGSGAYRNVERISVSLISTLNESTLLCTSPKFLTEKRAHPFFAIRDKVKLTRMWGDCYGHCLVASGQAEVMIDPEMKPWDCAALLPIVTEAGGKCFDFEGRYHAYGESLVSANGFLGNNLLASLSPKKRR